MKQTLPVFKSSWQSKLTLPLVWLFTTLAMVPSVWSDRVKVEYDTGTHQDTRLERSLSIYVPVNEPATPFVNKGTFEAKLESQLIINARQKVTFEMRGQGEAKLAVNDIETLDSLNKASEAITLSEGRHEIRIHFKSPQDKDAALRLFWKTADFDFEAVPSSALAKRDVTMNSSLRTARHLVAQQKCVACHQTNEPLAMPELIEKAPSLTGLGSRLNPAWVADWILNPSAIRADAHMPTMFRDESAAEKAAHIATFLASSRGRVKRLGGGDSKTGGQLFQELGCYACHSIHDESSDRISLLSVDKKFLNGVLATFLQAPAQHYPDSRMPTFDLSDSEAEDLAAFLRSLNKDKNFKKELSFGNPDIGRNLVISSGCLNCHEMQGMQSALAAPDLLAVLNSEEGCRNPASTSTSAPRFNADLKALNQIKDPAQQLIPSLGKKNLAEYSHRQFTALNCVACHQRDSIPSLRDQLSEEVAHLSKVITVDSEEESAGQAPQKIPSLNHLGSKLKTEWLTTLLEGTVPEKTRPWLKARMPAWPSRAKNMATGFAHAAGISADPEMTNPGSNETIDIGETLVGIQGFSCNACHAIGDQPALAVFEGAGPNLKLTPGRLRNSFYHQWMHFPQRITPMSIMPRFAENNISPLKQYFDGNADKQFTAIHDYLFKLASDVPPGMQSGLIGEYYKVSGNRDRFIRRLNRATPFFLRIDPKIDFPNTSDGFYGTKLNDQFLVRWHGSLKIPSDGTYHFHLSSDDGSRLSIDGKSILDFLGPHSFGEKSVMLELGKGKHEIELLYEEIGGGQGCQLAWTPPGEKKQIIPSAHFLHAKKAFSSIRWNRATWEDTAEKEKPIAREIARTTESIPAKYGSLIGTAARIGSDARGDNVSFRSHVVKLDQEGNAGIVFDTDTMRVSGAWLNGGLRLEGLPFTGGHGAFPSLREQALFSTGSTPGWADATGNFVDPRRGAYPPLGHLPKDWTHYKGLYRHGDSVVFHYTVGNTKVLEHPSLIQNEDQKIISRLLEIAPHTNAKTIALADAGDQASQVDPMTLQLGTTRVRLNTPLSGARLEIKDGQARLTLPPAQRTYQVEILFWSGVKPLPSLASRKPTPIWELLNGGPVRWPEVVITKGELAEEDVDEPYVLDRITLPYDNPWGLSVRVGGFDFFSDNTSAALCTWDGDVWIVKGISDSLEQLEWKRFASGIHEPLGLKIVDDIIYTLSDDQITRYHDLNKDGEADYYENFNNDWELTSGFHAFLFDLHTDPEGNFVFAFGSPVRGGGRSFERMSNHHGSVLKVSKDGSTLTKYASGLRAPNGIGVSPTGQITTGDNEGTFVPRCPINWVSEDDFLGVVDSYERRDQLKTTATVKERRMGREPYLEPSEEPRPLAWLPKGVDNSGGGQGWVTTSKWGPFEGEMLHGSYGQSSLYLVLKERIGDQMQGGVVKFPLRPTSSVMRLRFNERDGQLYISGLKGWQSNAGRDGGFDRVRYTGKPVAMPSGLNVTSKGLRLKFTQPLDRSTANDAGSFSLRGSDLLWNQEYGTKEYLLGQRELPVNERKTGWSAFKISKAELQPDGQTVELTIDDWQRAHMLELNIDLKTVQGQLIRTKVNHTVHVIP
ncbi:PA14 domain-containing protein [Verrucomicrobia bacterium]|nr:PA14 domain-containing protein [Verrucomicrobiota bacterium]